MMTNKVYEIEKLSDTSLENVSGGSMTLTTKNNMMNGGGVIATVGLLGIAVFSVADVACELNGNKKVKQISHLAKKVFCGVAALGGATYICGKVG